MKKLILHALCALTLCAGMPAHAMYDRVKSYMPKMSMPKVSMPSVDYKTAFKRFSIAKQRFEKALKSNKKAIITTAAVALLAAIGMVLRARSQAAAAHQGGGEEGPSSVGVSEEQEFNFLAELRQSMANADTDIDYFIDDILALGVSRGGIILTPELVQEIWDSPLLATSLENRGLIYQYLNNEATFPDLRARDFALIKFRPTE